MARYEFKCTCKDWQNPDEDCVVHGILVPKSMSTGEVADSRDVFEKAEDDNYEPNDQDYLNDCCGGSLPKEECCFYMPFNEDADRIRIAADDQENLYHLVVVLREDQIDKIADAVVRKLAGLDENPENDLLH